MVEFFAGLQDWAIALVDSPWVLLVIYVLATIDGFFPPVPSESIVISVAALAMAPDSAAPNLWLVILVAAGGALSGDLIAYTFGGLVPVERMWLFHRPRGARALAASKRAMGNRGPVLIMSGRFVPVGRVAVNMAAGAVGYPRPRFSFLAAVAAVMWALYSTLLGMGAGVVLDDHPLIGLVVGVAGGVALGFLLEAALRRLRPVPPEIVELSEASEEDTEGTEDTGDTED